METVGKVLGGVVAALALLWHLLVWAVSGALVGGAVIWLAQHLVAVLG